MKLVMVPQYERIELSRGSNRDPSWPQQWKLLRRDVVDLAGFSRAMPVCRHAVFSGEDRLPEPMVGAIFTKHGTYELYNMPESDFKRILGTDLAPSLP